MSIRTVSYILITVLLFTGCSAFVTAPTQHATGSKVVCILHDETEFKKAVIGEVAVELSAKGYTVITDESKRAKYYPADNYGAIVYMAQYWAWHVPWHQTSYYKNNNKPSNTVFVVTSGDPDVTINKPFDAITSVSKQPEVKTVAQDILNRLDNILK